jgi:hypothetical protein
MITSLFSLLGRANSAEEVVAVALDFIATLTPGELALLPPACRPGRLRDGQDVEALHAMLVEEYRGTRVTGDALEVLQRLTSFVVRASLRRAELDGEARRAQAGSPSGAKRSAAPREG